MSSLLARPHSASLQERSVRAVALCRRALSVALLISLQAMGSCSQSVIPAPDHPTAQLSTDEVRKQLVGTWELVSRNGEGPPDPQPSPPQVMYGAEWISIRRQCGASAVRYYLVGNQVKSTQPPEGSANLIDCPHRSSWRPSIPYRSHRVYIDNGRLRIVAEGVVEEFRLLGRPSPRDVR